MNPDDTNNSQGGSDSATGVPADMGSVPAQQPEAPAQPMGGEQTTPGETPAPESAPAASLNCHCGKPSAGGNCTGCNQPEAGCSCTPAA